MIKRYLARLLFALVAKDYTKVAVVEVKYVGEIPALGTTEARVQLELMKGEVMGLLKQNAIEQKRRRGLKG